MYKFLILSTALFCAFAVPSAQASDIFSRIDNALSTAERAMDSTDRTLNRADRLGDRAGEKVPDAARRRSGDAQVREDSLSASEAETLRRAEEIEERRILREAEAIRKKRGY